MSLYDEEGPTVWPECEKCGTTFVLRKSMSFSRSDGRLNDGWLWQPDCKHKMTKPLMVNRP